MCRKAVDGIGRQRGGGIAGVENPDFVGVRRQFDHLPDRLWRLRSLRLARMLSGNRHLHASFRPRPRRRDLTAAPDHCVQVRKIAIRITMTAITATAVFVIVTNV